MTHHQPWSSPAQRRVAAVVAVLFALTSVVVLAHPRPTLAWDVLAFSGEHPPERSEEG